MRQGCTNSPCRSSLVTSSRPVPIASLRSPSPSFWSPFPFKHNYIRCFFFGFFCSFFSFCFRGLSFTWWECYGLCPRHNQPSVPTPFYFVLVSVSVFMALSTVFHSINSSDNSPLSHSVLPVLLLPYWSFQLYISL